MTEIRILNRIARRTPHGYEWEADPRHAELIIQQMGLVAATSLSTPGNKDRDPHLDEEPLQGEEATAYRAAAARANYLAMDRADIQYAAKEVCRKMATPRRCDWQKVKRLARYLVGVPRVVQQFNWQASPDRITAIVDTDYAGCLETRKSTSGGVLMHGSHCIRSWSTTQSVIALSSGEAELYGIVKGASAGLGFQSIAKDLGSSLYVDVYSDSAAAKGMVRRTGLGKVRHIHVQELWVQQALRENRFGLYHIPGVDNPADILTKYVEKAGLDKHCNFLGIRSAQGRPKIAPLIVTPISPTGS